MKPIQFIRKPIVIANVLFIIALVVFFSRYSEFSTFIELIRQVEIPFVCAALVLQILTYLCNGAMWTTTLLHFGRKISLGLISVLSVMKVFVDQMIPSFGMSGDLIIARKIVGQGVTRGEAATVIIINLFTRYISYIILFETAVILVWFRGLLNQPIQLLALIFSTFVAGACVALFFILRSTHRGNTHQRIPKLKFLKTFIDALGDAQAGSLRHSTLWINVSLLQAGIFILDALSLWALIASLGISTDFAGVFISFMMASAVSTLSIIPAGVGVFEGTAVATLLLFKVPFDIAVAATLLLRGFAYWIPMIPGAIVFWKEVKGDAKQV